MIWIPPIGCTYQSLGFKLNQVETELATKFVGPSMKLGGSGIKSRKKNVFLPSVVFPTTCQGVCGLFICCYLMLHSQDMETLRYECTHSPAATSQHTCGPLAAEVSLAPVAGRKPPEVESGISPKACHPSPWRMADP